MDQAQTREPVAWLVVRRCNQRCVYVEWAQVQEEHQSEKRWLKWLGVAKAGYSKRPCG